MLTAYIAHPLGQGPDREKNRRNAANWCAYIAEYTDINPVAMWIVLSGVWPETPEFRKIGLKLDLDLIRGCGGVILVGGRVSEGMAIERDCAVSLGIPVLDLTGFGYEVTELSEHHESVMTALMTWDAYPESGA